MESSGLMLEGVGLRFGGLTALSDVSLRVPPGQVVGVIGPNGAGKSTLFNVICGLLRPDTGRLLMDGRALRRLRPHQLTRLGVARTLQDVGLFDGLSVLENVMAGATNRARAGFASALFGLPRSGRDERRLRDHAREVLDELGLSGFADASPPSLPYAIRQRVALARALAARPRLLLLDEPAGGLGPEDIDKLSTLIQDLPRRADHPCSVLLVEHHMDLVMGVCDEVVVLNFGRVLITGTPDQVGDDPRVAEAYLGATVEAAA
ncbi:ABC transporter ATP-binding protein [Micromonospora sp. WMMD710]|uniref:ABC transporter ATP-binding protein n=1 Tax=Micromonospora sp. WMMD710 TaxID=3016085 RepID=UPI0024175172|nr:ABC transporter ATP-binding protein [Micromonospora sp. WMMD710]MDG4758247.1 ABC transporter ATP-binding protein [Micromonospora sp. WMMD710]